MFTVLTIYLCFMPVVMGIRIFTLNRVFMVIMMFLLSWCLW